MYAENPEFPRELMGYATETRWNESRQMAFTYLFIFTCINVTLHYLQITLTRICMSCRKTFLFPSARLFVLSDNLKHRQC